MRDFIINEENFSLSLMEKVPTPRENEIFLLYRTGEDACMVINNGGKYSSTAIRHRHYNKKVILSLQAQQFKADYRIVMVDVDFYFNVQVRVSYRLQDARKYYFQGQMKDKSVSDVIRECVRRQHKRWNVSQGWELQNDLEKLIGGDLRCFQGVEFDFTIEITPDEEAIKIQESNRNKAVGIHTSKNMTEEQIAKNTDKEKIAASEFKYKLEKIKDMAYMMQNFGDLGPIVNEYLDNKIDGMQFREYIMKAKKDDIDLLKVVIDTDTLSQKEIIDQVYGILEGRFKQTEQHLLTENTTEQKALQVQEKEEDMQEDAIRQDTYVDGGFL